MMQGNTTIHSVFESPLGPIWLALQNGVLTGLYFKKNKRDLGCQSKTEKHLFDPVIEQLVEYLDGKRTSFDFPFRPQGTPFQKEVWGALSSIPYGQTVTYSDIANQINKPNAVRAVGAAVGRNPISIVVPCHRVLGKNGRLTGYAGGVDAKARLLEIEQVFIPSVPELIAV